MLLIIFIIIPWKRLQAHVLADSKWLEKYIASRYTQMVLWPSKDQKDYRRVGSLEILVWWEVRVKGSGPHIHSLMKISKRHTVIQKCQRKLHRRNSSRKFWTAPHRNHYLPHNPWKIVEKLLCLFRAYVSFIMGNFKTKFLFLNQKYCTSSNSSLKTDNCCWFDFLHR